VTGWLAATAVVGKGILVCSGAVLLLTMGALAIYALRRGEPDDSEVEPTMRPFGPQSPTGQTGWTRYKGKTKLKVLFNRRTRFIPMEALVDGSATREEWAAVICVQLAFLSFWLVFLGGALIKLEDTNGLSLLLPVVVGFWLGGILSVQWRDLAKARKKFARSTKRATP
jgi:hypothetical protein